MLVGKGKGGMGEMSLADPIHLEEASTDGRPCRGKRARVAWYICGRLLLLQEYGKRPDLILSSPASQLFVSVSVL